MRHDSTYRLVEYLPRGGRLWIADYWQVVVPGGYSIGYVWSHDVKRATLFNREDALAAATIIDRERAVYRAARPELLVYPLRPLKVMPTTGGTGVERRKVA
jgi:hypothetical protein